MSGKSILAQRVENLEMEEALDEASKMLETGLDPLAVLAECRAGMEGVGKRFEAGEYFVADLMLSADIFNEIMIILGPVLKSGGITAPQGKILIATVRDDIHDIGKNLVASMLRASGFEVADLGVNVEPEAVCLEIIKQNPDILALSCLLTSTIDGIEDTIAELNRQGLKDQVKVIVGGAPLNAKLAKELGADTYGADAYEAIIRCRELMGM